MAQADRLVARGPREVVNAILYLVRTGCQWRVLLKGLPTWSTVHTCYRRWRQDGIWERINEPSGSRFYWP